MHNLWVLARQSPDASSPAIHLLANPPPPEGRGYIEAAMRAGPGYITSAWGSTFPSAVIPDVWLRLRRWGDQFGAFRSVNGADWTLMGQTVLPLADPIRLGLAACSYTAAEATSTKF